MEHLAAQGGPLPQHTIASLRLVSKLLHKHATPHFYKTIQISHYSHTADLVAQLQAQPKLCDTTRAIWWDDKPDSFKERLRHTATPYLVQLSNVEEVAYTCTGKTLEFESPYPVGLHYALRPAGPWCQPLSFLRPPEPVEEVQRTPTYYSGYVLGYNEESLARTERFRALEQKWEEEHPDEGFPYEPLPGMAEIYPEPSRAIYAVHLVVPALTLYEMSFYTEAKTVTHLTITLYERLNLADDAEAEFVLGEILDLSQMPLLQHL